MLNPRQILHGSDQRGAMTVAAIVIIALLFTTGAVLSLAVSADLHAVNLVTSQDQVHYTAESNLARGTAAALNAGGSPCPGPVAAPVPSGDPDSNPAPAPVSSAFECEPALPAIQQPVGQLAQPAQTAAASSCIKVNLDSIGGAGPWAVWTVTGAHGLLPGSSYDIWVATSKTPACSYNPGPNPGSDSPVQTVAVGQADATYHSFVVTTAPEFLYILVKGGKVAFSPFVVRGASKGTDQVVTVIGRSIASAGGVQSVIEADEADLYFPSAGGARTAGLWRTVLP